MKRTSTESRNEMNPIIYADLENVCRGCMGKKGEMQPLYGSCLDQMLMEVAEIQVHDGDGLPMHMCVQCVLQVSRAFTFKQQCQRTDTLLRNCLHQQSLNNKLPSQSFTNDKKKLIKNIKIENLNTNKANELNERILTSDASNSQQIQLNQQQQQEPQQQQQQPVEIQFNDPSNGEKCLFIFQHMPLLNEEENNDQENDIKYKLTNNLENIHNESVTTFHLDTELMQQGVIGDTVTEFETYQHNIVDDSTFQCDSMISTNESSQLTTNTFDNKELNEEIVQLFCVECGLEFSTINDLKNHTNLMHSTTINESSSSSTSLISQSQLDLLEQRNLQSILPQSIDTIADVAAAAATIINTIDLSENDKKPPFKCDICEKIFAENKILRRHMKIHSPNKPHVCNICEMSFAESSNLTKHKKKHTGELRNVIGKPNLCSVCGKRFKWASSLSKHMKHHTKHKVLHCPYCPKYYVEARSLSIHIRSHTGEKPFVCDVCQKGFTQMGNLEKHMRVHTGEKPFICQICGKGFSQSGYVAIHMRTHTGERPYQCKDCGKCFAGSNTLAIHKRTHTGERPYQCKVCSKSFARQETAIIHGRTHTGEKPHVCPICKRGFTSPGHLTGHMRSHNGEKPHECTVCSKRFAGRSSLKVHMKSHTNISVNNSMDNVTNNPPLEEAIGCGLCDEKFNDYSALEQHEFSHDILNMNNGDSVGVNGSEVVIDRSLIDNEENKHFTLSSPTQPSSSHTINDEDVIELELDKIIDSEHLIL